jgi:transposase
MKEQTRAKWAERIRQWRDSGQSAEEFTAGKDYEPSALRWAASQLRDEKERPTIPLARTSRRSRVAASVVPAAASVQQFMRVRVRQAEPASAEMTVEVAGARIRVTRGVDIGLLGDIVRALQGGSR